MGILMNKSQLLILLVSLLKIVWQMITQAWVPRIWCLPLVFLQEEPVQFQALQMNLLHLPRDKEHKRKLKHLHLLWQLVLLLLVPTQSSKSICWTKHIKMNLILNMGIKVQEEAEGDAMHVIQRPLGIAPSVYQKLPKELGIVIVYLAQGSINAMYRMISALQ